MIVGEESLVLDYWLDKRNLKMSVLALGEAFLQSFIGLLLKSTLNYIINVAEQMLLLDLDIKSRRCQ